MNRAQEPDLLRGEQAGGPSDHGRAAARSDHRRWNDVLARGLFETVIVAVGVFLALAVDEWRERSEQRQLAEEARAALRTEILANRGAILARLRRTSQLFVQTAAHPDQVGQYVFERRNRQLLLNDAAWTMTVQTGAIRWLTPAERASIADVYAGHERMRDVVFEEMIRWTELAAFQPNETSGEVQGSRDRAIRVWQGFSQRVQLALCINAARHERALGAKIPQEKLMEFCAQRPPNEDPASMYRQWERLGWVSPTPPRLFTEGSAD